MLALGASNFCLGLGLLAAATNWAHRAGAALAVELPFAVLACERVLY